MRKAYMFFFVLFSAFCGARDSLKVYIIGDFYKGEAFKIHTKEKVYFIHIAKKATCATRAWSFYLRLDSMPKEGSLLPILIEKRRGRKYYDTELKCYYQADRKYFIIWKDFRQSRKYPFIEIWSKQPLSIVTIRQSYWSDYSPELLPVILSEHTKYEYFFSHLKEFYKE